MIFRAANLVQFTSQLGTDLPEMIEQEALNRRGDNGSSFFRGKNEMKNDLMKNIGHGCVIVQDVLPQRLPENYSSYFH